MVKLESRRADLKNRRDTIHLGLWLHLRHAKNFEGDLFLVAHSTLCCAHRSRQSALPLKASNPVAFAFNGEENESNLVSAFVLHYHRSAVLANIDETMEDVVTIDSHFLDMSCLQVDN